MAYCYPYYGYGGGGWGTNVQIIGNGNFVNIGRGAEDTKTDETVSLLRIENDTKTPAMIALKSPGGFYVLDTESVAPGETKDHYTFKAVYDLYIASGKQTVAVSGLNVAESCEIVVSQILKGDTSDLPISTSKVSVGPDTTVSEYFPDIVAAKLTETYKTAASDKVEIVVAKLHEVAAK